MPTILMPALSPTMEEVKLSKWLVKEGDTVKPGDVLAEIETDKATMEVESVDSGKVVSILIAEGTEARPITIEGGRFHVRSPGVVRLAHVSLNGAHIEGTDGPVLEVDHVAMEGGGIALSQGAAFLPGSDALTIHGAPGEPTFLDEPIDIVAGTRLASILGTHRVTGRSGHHQAVDRVGDGLVVAARALDGIVEGVEDPDRFYLGVQWHPEDEDGPAADRQRLFSAFVDAAEMSRQTAYSAANCASLASTAASSGDA